MTDLSTSLIYVCIDNIRKISEVIMKLVKPLIIVCASIIIIALSYQIMSVPPKPKIGIQKELDKAVEIKQVPNLDICNNRNKLIRNFQCDKMKIVAWYNGMAYKLNGDLFYEKENKFRMIIKSLVGTEADIGSNEEMFWFWFKRMKPKGLYFAKHEDLHKTGMKTPFNPLWIMKSLGLDQEEMPKNARILQTDQSWIIKALTEDSNGRLVYKVVLFDKEIMRIKGYILQDAITQQTISASVISSYNTKWIDGLPIFIPKEIAYSWYEEDVTMLFVLESSEVNHEINKEYWNIPYHDKTIDMGNEIIDSMNVE